MIWFGLLNKTSSRAYYNISDISTYASRILKIQGLRYGSIVEHELSILHATSSISSAHVWRPNHTDTVPTYTMTIVWARLKIHVANTHYLMVHASLFLDLPNLGAQSHEDDCVPFLSLTSLPLCCISQSCFILLFHSILLDHSFLSLHFSWHRPPSFLSPIYS